MKRYYVITHTHWDREWYFTKEETKVLLRQHMFDLFDFLENNPDVRYILDGQTVMIDDFLELAPEAESKLRHFIQQGNIKVGPWYTQTDLMLTRGESIVRNLYYGLKLAREFTNSPMLVGYAPDTFGHNPQMPQIYKGFEINSTYFWCGVSTSLTKNSNFSWRALDGTTIFAHTLASGYQGGKYLKNELQDLNYRLGEIEERYNRFNTFEDIIVMNGHDQMPVQRDLPDIIENYNRNSKHSMSISTFEDYAKVIQKKYKLETISGELYDAQIARVHKTISSTRMDIKLLNTFVEDKIYNELEPLSVIASKMGIPYPHSLIEKALKLLFGAHAHDSLGGCNTDFVNETIYYRLEEARELVENQIEVTLRQIGLFQKSKGYDAFLINLLPYKRKNVNARLFLQTKENNFKIINKKGVELNFEIVDQSLEDMAKIDRQILARQMDVQRYESLINIHVEEFEPLSIYPLKLENSKFNTQISNSEKVIQNEFYKVEFNESLDLTIKSSGKKIKNFIYLENNGDGGDGYDYSPMKNDWVIGENDFKVTNVDKIRIGNLSSEVVLTCEMELPYDEKERIKKIKSVKQQYTVKILLQSGQKEIAIEINLNNKIKDQRTRLGVRTIVEAENVKTDTQYGNHYRPSINPNLEIWEKESWVEKPVSIEHFESYVSLKNKQIVYAKGLKEYEHDIDIYITMFRSMAFMGRSDLINRPGRASGMAVPTPKNQMINKDLKFNFWLNYLGEENPDHRSKEILTSPISYQVKEINRFNINRFKDIKDYEYKVELELNELAVTAVKLNENDEVIIRGYNPTNKEISLDLKDNWKLSNLGEEIVLDKKIITIKPYEIFTIIDKGE